MGLLEFDGSGLLWCLGWLTMPYAVRSPSARLVCHIVEACSYCLMYSAASNSSLPVDVMCDNIVPRCSFMCAWLYLGSSYAQATASCTLGMVCRCRKSSIVAAYARGYNSVLARTNMARWFVRLCSCGWSR